MINVITSNSKLSHCQQFLIATDPASFFFRLRIRPTEYQVIYRFVPEGRCLNKRTGEQLLIQKYETTGKEVDGGDGNGNNDLDENEDLLIGRCSSAMRGSQWLQAMDQKADEIGFREQRTFSIVDPKIAYVQLFLP